MTFRPHLKLKQQTTTVLLSPPDADALVLALMIKSWQPTKGRKCDMWNDNDMLIMSRGWIANICICEPR